MNSFKNDPALASQQHKNLKNEVGGGELDDLIIKDAKKDKRKEEKGRSMEPRMN
jgi:hypothetical protein